MTGGAAAVGSVRYQDRDGVRSIAIDRVDKANALNADMMQTLADAVAGAGEARLIAIEGRGPRGFCAGADIAEFLQGNGLQRQEAALKAIAKAILGSRAPVVAAIHGRTLGAGVFISALSDIVIAADNLIFGLPEIRFNMYPVMVHAALGNKVSDAIAHQLCATGRLIDASEARSLGLVSDILPSSSFSAGLAERLAFYRDRAEALAIGRRTLHVAGATDVLERIESLAALMHENFHRPGVRETITRYLGERT